MTTVVVTVSTCPAAAWVTPLWAAKGLRPMDSMPAFALAMLPGAEGTGEVRAPSVPSLTCVSCTYTQALSESRQTKSCENRPHRPYPSPQVSGAHTPRPHDSVAREELRSLQMPTCTIGHSSRRKSISKVSHTRFVDATNIVHMTDHWPADSHFHPESREGMLSPGQMPFGCDIAWGLRPAKQHS